MKKEDKEEKERQEQKKRLIQRYNLARKALLEACLQCEVPFDIVFARYTEDLCDNFEPAQISKINKELNSIIVEIAQNHFIQIWDSTIENCFDENNREGIYLLVHDMIKRDPVDMFLSFSKTNKELVKLSNNQKDEALMDLEEYSSRNSLEEVTNTYGLMFYSKFGKDAINACLNGFKRNREVNPTYISAYFKANVLDSQMVACKGLNQRQP